MAASASSSRRVKVRLLAAASSALACLVLAGCGPSSSISIKLDESKVSLDLGGTEQVGVTLVRSGGATGAVDLDADGAPAWVDVSFDPPTLGSGETTSTMTLVANDGSAGAGPTTFTLTVTANGAGLSAQATLAVEVVAADVAGVVVDIDGDPLPGYTVYLAGRPPQLTGADGAFAFAGVAVPYDLTVVSPDVAGQSFAQTFVGLTTASPRVVPAISALTGTPTSFMASVSGSLLHATLSPLPPEHAAQVCVEGVDTLVLFSCDLMQAGETTYLITPTWAGSEDAQVRVRAVVYHVGADAEPDDIVAVGTSPTFTLGDGGNETRDITITETTAEVTAIYDATVPPGLTVSEHMLIAHHGEFASTGLPTGSSSATTGTLVAPQFDGADYTLFVIAYEDPATVSRGSIAWETGVSPGDTVHLDLPTPPVLVAPPDAAPSVSTSTVFTVIDPEDGVLTFLVVPIGPGTGFIVTTDQPTAQVPDLSAIGLSLASGGTYNWTVLGSPDLDDIDEAVAGDGYIGPFGRLNVAYGGGAPGPATGGRFTTSKPRTFTAQ